MFYLLGTKCRFSFFSTLTLLMLLLPSPSSAGGIRNLDRECWAAQLLDLETAHNLPEDRWAPNLFRIEVPDTGLLLSEITTTSAGSGNPSVEVLDDNCHPLSAREAAYIRVSPGRTAIKMHTAGVYHVRVTDPPVGNETFLRIGFSYPQSFRAEAEVAKAVHEWEEDDEGLQGSTASAVQEWEEDDEGLQGSTASAVQEWEEDDEGLQDSTAKSVEEWEEDDEGLRSETRLDCRVATGEFDKAVLTLGRSGILAIEAPGLDVVGFLERLDSDSNAAMIPLPPSSDILVKLEAGTYSLRWRAPDLGAEICAPRIGFYPSKEINHLR